MEKLSITVTEEHAEKIRDRVESGEYGSASEVIRAAIRALEKDDELHQRRLEAIRQRIKTSIEDSRPSISHEELGERIAELTGRKRKRA